jgi:hypothetical protein
MKNTLSNNKSRFLSVLLSWPQSSRQSLFYAQESYLFASVNGNGQNFGGAVFQYTPPGASMNPETGCKLQSNSS